MGVSPDASVTRDLVVIGASAGGVEALQSVVAGLPAALDAAVLVVLHMPAQATSTLPAILTRRGLLPAEFARHGEPLRRGRIHVAVPDHHLLVRDSRVVLSRAPKQNRVRPAIDALFRSAARWHGIRTIGVVLSGSLDDGAVGLAAIDSVGGACVVQDPADATVDGMPRAALAVVKNAVVRPANQVGSAIAELVAEPITQPTGPFAPQDLIVETEMTEIPGPMVDTEMQPGRPVTVSCPDCSGGMRVVETGTIVHYRCHVGHVWSPQTLMAAQREKIEQALWTAVSILEEEAAIHEAVAEQAANGGVLLTENHERATSEEVRRAAEVIRKHFPDYLPDII